MKQTFVLLIILSSFISNFLHAQNTPVFVGDTAQARHLFEEAQTLRSKKNYTEALRKLDTVEHIMIQSGDTRSKFFGEILYNRAFCLRGSFSYNAAITITDTILDKFESLFGQNSDFIARTRETRGGALYGAARFNEAIEELQKALKMRAALSGENATASILMTLSPSYSQKGDQEKALFYISKLIGIYQKQYDEKTFVNGNLYNILSIIYAQMGDWEKAESILSQNIKLVEKHWGENYFQLVVAYTNLAIFKKHLKLYDEAIADLNKSYQIALANWEEGQFPDFGATCVERASVYSLKGEYQKCFKEYEKAISLLQKFKEEEVTISDCYYGIATAYFQMKDYVQAAENIKLAKKFNHYTETGHFEKVVVVPKLIQLFYLSNQNYLLAFQQTGKYAYLDSAYYEAQSGVDAINFMKKELTFSESQSRLTQDNYMIYEGLLQVLVAMKRDSSNIKAFNIAEQSKGLQLYEAMKNAKAINYVQIPQSYLAKEKLYQTELSKIGSLKQEFIARNVSPTDSAFMQTIALEYEWQLKNDSLKADMAQRYGNYYRLKYANETQSLTDVQTQLLQPRQTFVEYFVGDSSLYAFIIKSNFYKVIEIKKDFPLEEWVKILRGSLNADSFRIQTDKYADIAHKLYEKLIQPFKKELTEEVIIVPDGVLGYVPFEALLTQKPEKAYRFQDHAYLIRDHSISYSFSATLLREMMQKKHQTIPTKSIIAYAPFYDGDTTVLAQVFADDVTMRRDLVPLSNSGEEVFRIAKAMGGDAIISKDATESKFKETATTARVLHLATHGKADDKSGDYSFLAFAPKKDSTENGLLYVRDLYNMTLNADMVVLSACETGIGRLQRGEGIISLARAFAYAGAKSIITSLWAVNDTKTKELMLLFYKNLKKGKTKDEALREAKLSFINQNPHPKAHPFFWAGFIGIGDMAKIK